MDAVEQSSPRILVVDDEVIIADTLALILKKAGFICRIAYHGSAALDLARQWTPDILLCDVYMPGLSGVEIAIELRALHPRCKILLLSGRAEVDDLLRGAREKGFHFDLLVKPVHPAELLKMLRED
jgi:CheY-like chemotaxis protein